jgi:hypothetical protein
MQAGDQIVEDMARGSEAYLQMWERANGIAPEACRSGRQLFFQRTGLGRIHIGDGPDPLLQRSGQPTSRIARTWSYCVNAIAGKGLGFVRAVYTPKENVALISSTSSRHRALGVGPGAAVTRKLLRQTKQVLPGVRQYRVNKARRFLFGVRGGRVRWVAVASPSATRTARTLRSYLKLAGLS